MQRWRLVAADPALSFTSLIAARELKRQGKRMPDITTTAATGDDAADRRRRIMAIVGSSSGNLVEWYDFYCYAFFALYFAPVFFPEGDSTSQLLNTAAVFAVGFFMRPIGGWLFGRIADRLGRKTSLMISVCLLYTSPSPRD